MAGGLGDSDLAALGAPPPPPPADDDGTPLPPPRPPVWPLLMGFLIVLLGAVATAYLARDYLANRPQIYDTYCATVAKATQEVLRENLVPQENIDAGSVEPFRRGRIIGAHHTLTVEVPPTLEAKALRDIVARDVVAQFVGSVRSVVKPGEVAFYIGDVPAATVVFAEPEASAAMPVPDAGAACATLAAALPEMLVAAGIPATAILAAANTGDAARMNLVLPEPITLDMLAARLHGPLSVREAMAVRSVDAAGTPALRIIAGGVECAVVVCYPPGTLFDIGEVEGGGAGELTLIPPVQTPTSPLPPVPTPTTPMPPAHEQLPSDAEPTAGAEPPIVPKPRAEGPARAAIILDDGGYGGETTERILALDPALTLSILPHTPEAAATAEAAQAAGFEVMLHMPMASLSNTDTPYPGELTLEMDAEQVRQATLDALATVPGVAGANNHTGSAFTAYPEGMRVFLSVLNERGLYFVDSRTHKDTVGAALARELGVPWAERTIFLDHEKDEFDTQFRALIAHATAHGAAVGIGHFRAATVAKLEAWLPQLQEAGITLVHASELLQ